MGTDYKIGNCKTIGELKSDLEKIIKDLPDDQKLEIFEVQVFPVCAPVAAPPDAGAV